MDLPKRFGKYELVRHLAKGGMAEIFLARSFGVEGFEKHLVIKRILPALAQSPRFVSLFIKEAKISAGLAHPNIVQIYELGRVGSDHYIAMEHIHGRDLTRINKALRAADERLPLALAVYVVACILRGLSYAHARTDAEGRVLNLIHRDVSPHNVMVSFLGEVKLFDFGIARLVGDVEPQPGLPGGGKYAYMSPEQASGQSLDPRSDIFSAGVVLYELLVGHRLFQDSDPSEKLRKVREAKIPDPREENPEIPDELWVILQSLLALEPENRPLHAEDAEEELWAFLFRHGMRADAHQLAAFMQEQFPGEAQGNPGVADLEGLASDLRRLEDGASQVTDVSRTEWQTGTPSAEGVKIPRLMRGASGEQKNIAVLMAEVTGFTDLSSNRDAQVVVRRHYQLLRRIRRIVDRHGGFLEHYQDDRFMVFFGVPKVGEHDLERCLACAEALIDATSRATRASRAVSLSIGIHRGEITMGTRAGRSFKYLARGDTIKLAHRLCSEADLGQVLVSDTVAAMSGGRFRFTQGPQFRRKGRRDEIKSFELRGARDRVEPVSGRWVPRTDELDQLGGAITKLAQDEGGVVAVMGDPGTGKTRFLREVQALARSRDVPFILARARPYRGYRPFDVLRDVAAHVLGIEREDSPDTVQSHFSRLREFGLTDADQDVIGAMFGLKRKQDSPVDTDRMIGAASRLLDGISARGPLIIATDDVQYVGRRELQLIGSAIRGRRAGAILFLFAGRGQLPSELRPADRTIELGKFNPDAVQELMCEMLGVEKVGPALIEVARTTSEGNPLYMDEVIRSLRQTGRVSIEGGQAALVGDAVDVHLPVSLEAMIAARVDALGPASKGVLQIASTIGLTFSPALVREASGMEDIGGLLQDLVDRGMIERGTPDEAGIYRFGSVLLWESVHRSILGVRLSQYHRMVADGMERLYGDKLDDERMQIASHCAAGGQFLRAAGYGERAGDLLRDRQILLPAIDCWEQGIAWLDQMQRPSHASQVREASLRLKVGEGWRLIGDPRKAEIHLQVAQDLAADVVDSEIEARATLCLGWLYAHMGRTILSQASLESARSMAIDGISAPSLEDFAPWRREVAVDALAALGTTAMEMGAVQKGENYLQDARRLAGSDDHLAARSLTALAQRHIRVGDEAASLEVLSEARERAERAGDRILLGRIVNNIGIVHHTAGRLEEALGHYKDALNIRQGLGYQLGALINLHNIGDVHLRLGDGPRAWAAFNKSRDMAKQMGYEPGLIMNDVFIAYLDGQRGEDGALGRLQGLIERAQTLQQFETSISAMWLLGRLRRESGDSDGARQAWEEGVALATSMEAPHLSKDLEIDLDGLGG